MSARKYSLPKTCWTRSYENWSNAASTGLCVVMSGANINGNGYYWLGQLNEKDRNYKTNKIWFCPNARRPRVSENGGSTGENVWFSAWGVEWVPTKTGSNPPTVAVAGSYGINGYMLNSTSTATTSSTGSNQNNWRGLNVKGGSNIPLFLDAIRYDGWPTEDEDAGSKEEAWTDATNNYMVRFCIDRHRRNTCGLFVDMHVRYWTQGIVDFKVAPYF